MDIGRLFLIVVRRANQEPLLISSNYQIRCSGFTSITFVLVLLDQNGIELRFPVPRSS
jgi:hypothetical protein